MPVKSHTAAFFYQLDNRTNIEEPLTLKKGVTVIQPGGDRGMDECLKELFFGLFLQMIKTL